MQSPDVWGRINSHAIRGPFESGVARLCPPCLPSRNATALHLHIGQRAQRGSDLRHVEIL